MAVLAAFSDALRLPLKSRPTIALEANDIVRIAEHALVTFDAAYRPVVLVTEWSAPQSADSPVAEASIRGGIIEIIAKVDPSGERVRVVFGSWHSQKRRFEDGTSTAIGWLSGPFTPDVQQWLQCAGVSTNRVRSSSAA